MLFYPHPDEVEIVRWCKFAPESANLMGNAIILQQQPEIIALKREIIVNYWTFAYYQMI